MKSVSDRQIREYLISYPQHHAVRINREGRVYTYSDWPHGGGGKKCVWVFAGTRDEVLREMAMSKVSAPKKITTASQLKRAVESANPASLFFSRNNMRHGGDTMANYGVRQPVAVVGITGGRLAAYELYRRRPVKAGLQASAWFCAETFRHLPGAKKI